MDIHGLGDVALQQRCDSLACELLAFDRGGLDDRALGGWESVEPGRDQRLDRRRDGGYGSGVVEHHGDDLLDEQRIAVGDVEDVLDYTVAKLLWRDQLLEEVARV